MNCCKPPPIKGRSGRKLTGRLHFHRCNSHHPSGDRCWRFKNHGIGFNGVNHVGKERAW